MDHRIDMIKHCTSRDNPVGGTNCQSNQTRKLITVQDRVGRRKGEITEETNGNMGEGKEKECSGGTTTVKVDMNYYWIFMPMYIVIESRVHQPHIHVVLLQ